MSQIWRSLTKATIVLLLAGAVLGCPALRDFGVSISVSPETVAVEADQDEVLLLLQRNGGSTNIVGPITLSSNAAWLTIDQCTDTMEDCFLGNSSQKLQIPLRVDRTLTKFGVNKAVITVRAPNASVVEVEVTVGDTFQPDFAVDKRLPKVGEAVRFTNTSQIAPEEGDIQSVKWDFGDGTSSNASAVSHFYTAPGFYAVSLTVNTTAEKSETVVKKDFIVVGDAKPEPRFSANRTNIYRDDSVAFTDESVASGQSPITSWRWDFGDGAYSTDQNPVHLYRNAGVYAVTLKVETAFSSYSLTKPDFILVQDKLAPQAGFELSQNEAFVADPVRFTDLSDPGTAPIREWHWDFGDGAVSSAKSPTHAYADVGVYTVTQTVVSVHGTSQASKQLTIVYERPTADFSADNLTPATGEGVHFVDLSVPGTTNIISWLWDFGDGTQSTVREPVHAYENPGKYTVVLTVRSEFPSSLSDDERDQLGDRFMDTKIAGNFLEAFIPPAVDFVIDLPATYGRADDDSGSGLAGDVVSFINTTTEGTEAISGWRWDFDNNPDTTERTDEDTSWQFTQRGVYEITLTAVTATREVSVTKRLVVDTPPQALFSADPRSAAVGDPVQFENLSETGVGGASGGTVDFSGQVWAFGDGAQSTDANPVHAYMATGRYDVSLALRFLHSDTKAQLVASAAQQEYIIVIVPVTAKVDTLSDTVDGDTSSLIGLVVGRGPDGFISLPEAILATNNQEGENGIEFLVQGTIAPTAQLPEVTDTTGGTTIDGDGNIVLSGANLAGGTGLTLSSANNVVTGLQVVDFTIGIRILGANASENQVRSCLIGTDGQVAMGNTVSGISIESGASANVIGGVDFGSFNLVSGNAQGISIAGETSLENVVAYNLIGSGASGMDSIPNTEAGIVVSAPATTIMGNLVAGTTDGTVGNLAGTGVLLASASSTFMSGNRIGTDIFGMNSLPNDVGVAILSEATVNSIGGEDSPEPNIISGNREEGVLVRGAGTSENTIAGNYIGLAADGITALPNGGAGVAIMDGASVNIVGGEDVEFRNLISGNLGGGVLIAGVETAGNQVLGNYIGLDVLGDSAVPNEGNGVLINDGAVESFIGGEAEGAGNTISGNTANGIAIAGLETQDVLVQGNVIGMTLGGKAAFGNGEDGIEVSDGASRVQIGVFGEAEDTAANLIAGNGVYGVEALGVDTIRVAIRKNAITDNVDAGISLTEGSNLAFPAPVITSLAPVKGTAEVGAQIDVYLDLDGEGRFFVTSSVADLGGNFGTVYTPQAAALPEGIAVTAIATNSAGNSSMFSVPVPVE